LLSQVHETPGQTLALGGWRDRERAQHGGIRGALKTHMADQEAMVFGHPAFGAFEALPGQPRRFQQGLDGVEIFRLSGSNVHGASGKRVMHGLQSHG
jgi:hypothetical protein